MSESTILGFVKKIKNEERAHLEAHYQKKLKDVKNNTAWIANLLKQLLWDVWKRSY